MNLFKKNIWQNPIGIWCLVFIIVNMAFRAQDGANPASRFATMRAMVEQGSFQIDSYKGWTVDWAQTPDGKYYSNKAPGPMFLGLPLFFVLEKITKGGRKEVLNEQGHRVKFLSTSPRIVMSFLMQMLPFALVVYLVFQSIGASNFSNGAINFGALAIFFGSTTSVLFNVYFGHGMTSIFVLLILYGLFKKNYFLIGLSFGFALLCEYTAAVLLPVLIAALIVQNKRDFKWIGGFILGGIAPGILWCWYHLATTGNVFKVISAYNNPAFQTAKDVEGNIAGLFIALPDIQIIGQLLFGPIRGLLFTQPWLLLLMLVPIFYYKKLKNLEAYSAITFFVWGGFTMLLLLNSMFEEWHSGWFAGPRYMCMIFPAIGVYGAMVYDKLSINWRRVLWACLVVGISFRGLVYATTILAPDVSLWNYLIGKMNSESFIRLGFYFLLLGLAYWRVARLTTRRSAAPL